MILHMFPRVIDNVRKYHSKTIAMANCVNNHSKGQLFQYVQPFQYQYITMA